MKNGMGWLVNGKVKGNRYVAVALRPWQTAMVVSELLKIGSWSFEGIIILLICFLNSRKALLQRNKHVSIKGMEFKVLN